MVAEPCGQKRLNAGSLWLELLSEEARVFLTRQASRLAQQSLTAAPLKKSPPEPATRT